MVKKITKIHKNVKRSRRLMWILLICNVLMIGAFGVNIFLITRQDDGQGETIQKENKKNEFSNQYYTIGNNPTKVNEEYFVELNAALQSQDSIQIASSVVKNFVSEYYTWTNKDGNYDIGGMQYMYKPKQADFEKYTRYNFYKDFDLYVTQLGRQNLMEVASVTVDEAAATDDLTLSHPSDQSEVSDGSTAESETLPCVKVVASWTYQDSQMSTADVQNHATFYVVDNQGRYEIGRIE